jgi:hypothetical protein
MGADDPRPHSPWRPAAIHRHERDGAIHKDGSTLTTDPRSRKHHILMGGAAIGVLIGVVIAAAAVYSASATVKVVVVNDETTELRLSGCVDDASDIAPTLTAQVDVPKRAAVGCNVFSFGTYKGCLVLHGSRPKSEKQARISVLLDSGINQAACEKTN